MWASGLQLIARRMEDCWKAMKRAKTVDHWGLEKDKDGPRSVSEYGDGVLETASEFCDLVSSD